MCIRDSTKTASNKYDAGITLGKDGKVIVVQNDRTIVGQKAKRVWDEFSDLQSAINWLADADTFEGYVSAVLNDNGSAKYIVFNGVAELGTVDDNGNGGGAHVREYPRGTLDVTSTDKMNALDVADAIRDFLNDSRIVDVDYNASTGKATVTYTGNRSVTYDVTVNDNVSNSVLAAAELMTKVQEAVEKAGKPYGAITIEGNKMTATGSSADYVDATKGENNTSQATLDFMNFAIALHNNGAETIEFNGATYKWNTDLRHASKWVDTTGTVGANGECSDTLVTDVVTEVTNQAQGSALAAGEVATITITVDGDPLVFVIRIPAAS